MADDDTPEDMASVVVTVTDEIITENGAFETFKAVDHTERSDCIVFFGTTVSDGTIRVQKPNLRSVVYL